MDPELAYHGRAHLKEVRFPSFIGPLLAFDDPYLTLVGVLCKFVVKNSCLVGSDHLFTLNQPPLSR